MINFAYITPLSDLKNICRSRSWCKLTVKNCYLLTWKWLLAIYAVEFHYDVLDVEKVLECLPKTFLCAFVCSRNDDFVITKRIFCLSNFFFYGMSHTRRCMINFFPMLSFKTCFCICLFYINWFWKAHTHERRHVHAVKCALLLRLLAKFNSKFTIIFSLFILV